MIYGIISILKANLKFNEKIIKGNKKDLKSKLLKSYNDILEAATVKTKTNPKLLNEYHYKMPSFYNDKQLNDKSLDMAVYK